MKTKSTRRIAAFTSILFVALAHASFAQDFSTASAINNNGVIIGGSLLDDQTGFDAFILTKRGVADLGTFGGFASIALGINERGDTVGQSDTAQSDLFGNAISFAFLADSHGVRSLGSLAGLNNSQAFAINNRGTIVGRAYNNAEDPSRAFDFRAFVFKHGAMRDIGTLGGATAEAFGINDRGSIVGDAQTAMGERHAFLFRRPDENDNGDEHGDENAVMRDLGTFGGNFSQARSINDRGQIVGRSRLASGQQHAFLYERGRMKDLGTLGGTFSRAEFINEHGQIVGFSSTVDGDFHAFLYMAGHMQDLGTLGGSYSAAFGINNHGEIIGESDTVTGDTHAFVARDGVMVDIDKHLPH